MTTCDADCRTTGLRSGCPSVDPPGKESLGRAAAVRSRAPRARRAGGLPAARPRPPCAVIPTRSVGSSLRSRGTSTRPSPRQYAGFGAPCPWPTGSLAWPRPRDVSPPRGSPLRRCSLATTRRHRRFSSSPAPSTPQATSRRPPSRSSVSSLLRQPRFEPGALSSGFHARQERQPELPTMLPRTECSPTSASPHGDSPRLGCLLRTGPRRGADSVPSTGCTGPAARPARSGAEKHRIETDGRVQVAVVFDSAALARPAANAAPLLRETWLPSPQALDSLDDGYGPSATVISTPASAAL